LALGLAAVAVLLEGLDLGAQRVRDHLPGGSRLVLVDQRRDGIRPGLGATMVRHHYPADPKNRHDHHMAGQKQDG